MTIQSDVIKDSKVVVVHHEYIPVGPGYDILEYLNDKAISKVLFIAHPLKEFQGIKSHYEYYERGELQKKKVAFHWRLPMPMLYIKDVIYTIIWVISLRDKFDLFVGLDPLNAFAGLLLRSLGKCNKVAFYTIDYFTKRFENPIMNKIYHFLDKICVRNVDETWNISPVMADAREEYNKMDKTIYDRQYVVPISVHFNKVKRKPFNKINKKKLIFTGVLVPFMGIDMVLDAMPELIKRIPKIKLKILGSGPAESALQQQVKELKITKHVKFHGWITKRKDLDRILSDGAIGIAPFNPKLLNDEIKNADPAKLKDYMLLCMPIIVSNAISTTDEIKENKCGIVISYNQKEFINAVVKLLTNEKLLLAYRKNALIFVEQFDYNNIYGKSFKRILSKNGKN